MPLVEQTRDRYLRSPRLVATPDGGATLHLLAWCEGGERWLRFPVDAGGHASAPVEGPLERAIADLSHDLPPEPTADPTDEDRMVRDGWRVEVVRSAGASTVWVTSPSGTETRVWERVGTAAAPFLAPTEGGAWVAFHHDVREDRGERDVAKWIALFFVDREGAVLEPSAAMTERDRDREGVEQSFEFPTLVVGRDGALDLFGRGSHNFYRQRVDASGFSPREALSDGEWGCRGRRIAVAQLLRDGATLTARREKKGIVLQRFDAPMGGAPSLRPAVVPALGTVRAPAPPSLPRDWPGPRVLFGDIHQHSAHSDGIGTADEAYLRARYHYGDDFAALTDHESFLGKRIGPGEWAYLEAVAEHHHRPGEFATIIAYEWTGRMYPGPGHKVCYLPGPGLRVISRDDVPEGVDIVRAVGEQGGFSVPHHVGWTGADEAAHDPVAQPVWEICSVHGCYECRCHPLGYRGDLEDQFVQEMLAKGHRFGFIACSDSHGLLWHHGVARKRDPFRTGLTAVLSEERTRAGILEAIRLRRCYATSGAKILLDTRAGEAPMGSALPAEGPVRVRARVHGTAALALVEWVGKKGVLASVRPGALRCDEVAEVDDAYVYVRVTQEDGEMAWSSPYFFGPSRVVTRPAAPG